MLFEGGYTLELQPDGSVVAIPPWNAPPPLRRGLGPGTA